LLCFSVPSGSSLRAEASSRWAAAHSRWPSACVAHSLTPHEDQFVCFRSAK